MGTALSHGQRLPVLTCGSTLSLPCPRPHIAAGVFVCVKRGRKSRASLNKIARCRDEIAKGHNNRRTARQTFGVNMIRKLALGLAATVAVGAAVLAPTAASAFSVKVGPGYHPHYYPHHHRVYVAPPLIVGAPLIAPGCMQKQMVQTKKGLRMRMVNTCAF
jgi:hypothetical protein